MIDLFNQPFYESHGRENSKHSEEIYEAQAVRLSKNTRAILDFLLSGQKLSGADLTTGILTSYGYIKMLEYRKRIDEIKRAGIILQEEKAKNGCKTWWLHATEFEKAKQLLK
jgi:hypothetical protein